MAIVRYLQARPEVEYTYMTLGGSALNNSVNRGAIYVKMTPHKDRKLSQQEFETDIRKVLPRFTGSGARVLQIGAVGGSAAPDRDQPERARTRQAAGRSPTTAIARIRDVPGLVELKSSLEGRKPEWVGGRESRARRATSGSASARSARRCGRCCRARRPATGRTRPGSRTTCVVRMAPEFRESRDDLLRVPVATSQVNRAHGRAGHGAARPGGHARRAAARRRRSTARSSSASRTIEGNYQGRPLTDGGRATCRRGSTAMPLPPGYRFDFGGEQADFVETVGYMLESLTLAVILLYLILAQPVRRLPQAAGDHAVAAALARRRDARAAR